MNSPDTPDIPDSFALPVFTVTVAGPERHDGEKPYTYVLHAPTLQTARLLAFLHHVESQELDVDWHTGGPRTPDAGIVEGEQDTFPGAPGWSAKEPGRAYNDLRQDATVFVLTIAVMLLVESNGADAVPDAPTLADLPCDDAFAALRALELAR